jgi:hypothetical protein
MSNWSRWENQPQIGWRSVSRSRAETYANAGAPGPALRYLYVQPTARSASHPSRSTGTAPTE